MTVWLFLSKHDHPLFSSDMQRVAMSVSLELTMPVSLLLPASLLLICISSVDLSLPC